MNTTVTIELDQDCLELFEAAAAKYKMPLSVFLQDAGLLRLLKNEEIHPRQVKRLLDKTAPASAPSRPQKPRYSPGEAERIFLDFAEYLNQKMIQRRGELFQCKYSLNQENCFPWIDPALLCGESEEENCAMEQLLAAQLFQAMREEDEDRCFQVVRVAMDWGGVYYSRGVRKGNKTQVEKLHHNHALLTMLLHSRRHIQNRELEQLECFSSGWSIIWFLMDMENLFILSSRKVFALNMVLQDYQRDRGLVFFPPSLELGQLVYQGPRYIEGVRYIYTQKAKLILFKKCVCILDALKSCGDFQSNKELDNLLYNMGEVPDISH